ncbi:MAG: hypothetical protein SD837_09030 [Candidatus Electrothrix scaldis]|nr:MAG: hypothetical protein SD837_09030 [Candidatus Electrothrix sp. GW3-3]
MEKQNEPQNKQKKPYKPPKATFIPLKIEERLTKCDKDTSGVTPGCNSGQMDS